MASIKFLIIAVILASLLVAEFTQAAPAPGHKKSRHHVKSKKSNNSSKLKAGSYKKAPAPSQANSPQHRNAKMNLYSPRSWPSTNSYYHTAASPMYLRSAPSSSMYYPMRWANSPNYFTSPSMMPSNYLRRSDDYLSSMSTAPTMSPSMSPSMMSLGSGSQTPTIIDMSAFTGGNGLLDNSFSSQNLWSMPEAPAPKSKFNLFNSFSLSDDGLFGGLFNQFK